ncbi:MAG: SpoIIE family protein phosphatase [Bacteroidales bacterium]|nr:SpoIIE family protein phosphatase [Bacteroidales bacterium]
MKKIIKILPFITLFLSLTLSNIAQNSSGFPDDKKIFHYNIDNWSKKDGLPTNSLINICQTDDGYIWISSYNGLIRVNGQDFSLFDKENTNAFSENGVGALTTDNNGTLWMTTQSSGLISYKEGQFTSHLTDSSLSQLYSVIFFDSKNRLWAASPIFGLFVYSEGKYQYFNNTTLLKNIEPNSIAEDKNGNIWIGTSGNGIIVYDNSDFSTYTTENGLISNWVNSIYIDDENLIWIGTDNGLCTFTKNSFNSVVELKDHKINVIISDQNKNIWLGTSNGLFLKRFKTNNYEHLNTQNGLLKNYILDLLLDKENTLWIVNYRGGLSRLKNGKFTCFTQKDGIKGTLVNSICEIEPNKLLFAFDNGYINILENNTISEYQLNSDLKGKRIRNVFKDSKNNLWISTYNGLLKVTEDLQEKWFLVETGFPDRYIRLVFEDSKNNIWVGTRNSGLVKINDNGTYSIFDKTKGLNVNLVMSIDEDKNGNILVGTSKGGLSIISNEGIIKTFTKKEGLTDDITFNTYVDKEGIIWVAAKGGLNLIINDKIFAFPVNSNTLPDSPFDILEDNNGFFWLTCSMGIMKISRQNLIDYYDGKTQLLDCILLDNNDGLIESECNSTAISIKSEDGKLWFPTLNGFAMIDPEKILVNDYIPPVYIDKILVDNKEVSDFSDLNIKPDNKRITFYYNALSYYEPSENLYKYKLEGFEENWSEETNEKSISYTNLPPGKYTFKIIGSNNDGFWNEIGAELNIRIKPHIYQTFLFWFLAFVLFLLLIYLTYKIRVKQLKKRQQILEELIQKRTSEIVEKNEELRHQKDEIELQTEQLEQLSIVVQETGNSVAIFDKDLNLLWANHSYIKVYGYSDLIFPPKKQIHITKISPREDIVDIVNECINEKKSKIYNVEKKNVKGEQIWVQVTITPIIEIGVFKQLIVIESDITELKLAEIAMTSQQNYITSSIRYAKSIQEAIFPIKKNIDKHFDNFIIFKPKDIVSGDFYWFTTIPERCITDNTIPQESIENPNWCSFLALADCTGHGVPGAFMSMLGNGLLNEIINIRKIYDPKEILNTINEDVRKLLKQDVTDNVEGMDIGLCLLRKEKERTYITYSGAKISLFHYQKEKKQIEQIKGVRKSIGGVFFKFTQIDFTNNQIIASKGDMIYMTSDGYIDQNNIERRRFGTKKLHSLLEKIAENELTVQQLIIEEEHEKWKNKEQQRDDISMIGIKI